jgi:hypothetical protein
MIQTMHMKTKYKLFRRRGVFYTEDNVTGKQKSPRNTRRNRSIELAQCLERNPSPAVVESALGASLNLTASDPAFVQRTWQNVMSQMQSRVNAWQTAKELARNPVRQTPPKNYNQTQKVRNENSKFEGNFR